MSSSTANQLDGVEHHELRGKGYFRFQLVYDKYGKEEIYCNK